ncbi:MAG: hypothetical protein HQM09_00505 [Candidatus Riflebacteria bacterium]|nr:hypothetical protein [Candidatus Riflebacteria bacterium]
MRINQNIVALNTQSTLATTNSRLEKSIAKLSSGLRINSAADDAAGLAISEKLRRQVRGLARAISNAQDGISMIQTGEGALNESTSILQRMRELAVQAGNDTLTSNDRLEVQKEVNQLRDDLNRISRNTEFNTKKLLDGSQTASISSSSIAVKGIVQGGAPNGVGGDYAVSIALVNGGIAQMARTQIFTKMGADSASLADGSTQLQSIAQFYDANGVFVLENTQAITLVGNDKTSSVSIDGQMTLDKLAANFQNAVNGSNGLDIANSKITLVSTSTTGVAGMGGYIQLVSGTIGENGKIGFFADQSVLSALGIATTREAKNNLVELSLNDSLGNTRQVQTQTDRAVGLLDGIDVQFASQAAQVAGTQGIEQGLLISAGAVVTATFQVQIGGTTATVQASDGYWTMEGLARDIQSQLDVTSGGIFSGVTTTIVDGQIRIGFTPPSNATIASTITISNASNAATLGFLNGTYSGFADGKKDTTKIEWGFSEYLGVSSTTNLSSGTSLNFLVGDGNGGTASITIITGTLSTTQFQIADMRRFLDFQATANELLSAATVKVRIDQIGGAMAFTATRVGRENVDNAASIDSVVSLTLSSTASVAGADVLLNTTFGFDAASQIDSRGSGDKNFRLHVVDNTPQFQIGADQGQAMKVAFADMSADALGVGSLDMTNIAGATLALGKLNIAIDKVSAERSKLGAYQNRLEYATNNLRSANTNLTAAESRIRDVDVASEMIEFTRDQIVTQAGTAMLAQANTLPQSVMQLLK